MEESKAVDISDDDEEEGYLKIFYDNCSKCNELPLDPNGNLLLDDVKAVEPNILSLNLIKNKSKQLCLPENGYFKEPEEKWSNFKVVAVLNDSTNAVFVAYNVSSFFELRKLLGSGNFMFDGCCKIAMNHLKRTMVIHRNKRIAKILWYAYNTKTASIKTFIPNAPDVCDLCDTPFTLKHLVSEDHIVKYQSKFNNDPPEISVLLENEVRLISTFRQDDESPEDMFGNFKENLVRRSITAKFKFPFEDPYFVEKLWFLRHNFKQHPTFKQIFPDKQYFCQKCNREFRGFNAIVDHILAAIHLRSGLTQDEEDKLYRIISAVNYSAHGFSYLPKNVRMGKRERQGISAVNYSGHGFSDLPKVRLGKRERQGIAEEGSKRQNKA